MICRISTAIFAAFSLVSAQFVTTGNWVTPALGQTAIKGVGVLTCGQFAQFFTEGDDDEKGQLIVALFSWTQGYFGGKNSQLPVEQQKDLTSLDPQPLLEEISGLCEQNGDAAIYLVSEYIFQQLPPLTIDINI